MPGGNINVKGFLIMKTNNLAHIVNTHLYFVIETVPYLVYIPTRLYLNATYTVSSTMARRITNKLIQMTIIDTLQL